MEGTQKTFDHGFTLKSHDLTNIHQNLVWHIQRVTQNIESEFVLKLKHKRTRKVETVIKHSPQEIFDTSDEYKELQELTIKVFDQSQPVQAQVELVFKRTVRKPIYYFIEGGDAIWRENVCSSLDSYIADLAQSMFFYIFTFTLSVLVTVLIAIEVVLLLFIPLTGNVLLLIVISGIAGFGCFAYTYGYYPSKFYWDKYKDVIERRHFRSNIVVVGVVLSIFASLIASVIFSLLSSLGK